VNKKLIPVFRGSELDEKVDKAHFCRPEEKEKGLMQIKNAAREGQ